MVKLQDYLTFGLERCHHLTELVNMCTYRQEDGMVARSFLNKVSLRSDEQPSLSVPGSCRSNSPIGMWMARDLAEGNPLTL
ncbi:hypothetical protein TNCV_2763881 [Trichonephila clavipes]|nr:hypothetical protein TNCV_2763881 [Trichonephila clavipes]